MDGTTPNSKRYHYVPHTDDDEDYDDRYKDDIYNNNNSHRSPTRSIERTTPPILRQRSNRSLMADHEETSSLVQQIDTTVDSHGFRASASYDNTDHHSMINSTDNHSHDKHEEITSLHSPLHNNQQHNSTGFSRSSSLMSDDELDGEWMNDIDDDIAVRRYHLDTIVNPRDIPLPVEFQNYNNKYEYIITKWKYKWNNLRQSARQRHAARLLTIPSESIYYKVQVCILSVCCDATDTGIIVAAIWISLWILIGIIFTNYLSDIYWYIGLLLFIIRISARRTYEKITIVLINRSRRRRLRATTNSSNISNNNNNNNDDATGGQILGIREIRWKASRSDHGINSIINATSNNNNNNKTTNSGNNNNNNNDRTINNNNNNTPTRTTTTNNSINNIVDNNNNHPGGEHEMGTLA